jgi:hypothetical protein
VGAVVQDPKKGSEVADRGTVRCPRVGDVVVDAGSG